jgi:hypothetical protein
VILVLPKNKAAGFTTVILNPVQPVLCEDVMVLLLLIAI